MAAALQGLGSGGESAKGRVERDRTEKNRWKAQFQFVTPVTHRSQRLTEPARGFSTGIVLMTDIRGPTGEATSQVECRPDGNPKLEGINFFRSVLFVSLPLYLPSSCDANLKEARDRTSSSRPAEATIHN